MKRSLFFWLEKLKITPHERITITGLMVLLLVLSLLNLWVEPGTAVNAERYQAIEQEFHRRTQLIAQQKARLMKRYNPKPAKMTVVNTPQDTIPEKKEDTTKSQDKLTSHEMSKSKLINVNTASLEKLKTLPGVGPVYAGRIVAYRDSTGGFESKQELINIKGIGDKRLEDIKPLVEL